MSFLFNLTTYNYISSTPYVVLVEPRNPLNIGAAARALSNFGFHELRLVNPYRVAVEEARSAVGAEAILQNAREFTSVGDAVADCTLVAGTTSGSNRQLAIPHIRLEAAVSEHIKPHQGRVAILFGSEKFGLSNEDLGHCHLTIGIPSRPEHRSINLGQAVAVTLYELIRDPETKIEPKQAPKPAEAVEVERVVTLMTEASLESGFFHEPTTESSILKLNQMLRRLGLATADAIYLAGLFRQILWKMRNPK